MNYPSVKTLNELCTRYSCPRGTATKIRRIMKGTREQVLEHPAAVARRNECYHEPSTLDLRMTAINALLGTHGVEYIPKGHNSKSPAIEYCNTGDTYAPTVMFVRGRFRVGCWGDIVEYGNYD